MRRRGIVLAMAVAGTLAACSSGGDAEPSTTTDAPTTVATTEPVPPTTAVPATTDAPTTTLDPEAELAAEVEADYREGIDLYNKALMDVRAEETVEQALRFVDGPSKEAVEKTLQEFRDRNLRILPEPLVEPSITIEKEPTIIEGSNGIVELRACEIDPWVVVEIGAGPGGNDAVVDDSVYAYRSTIRLREVDDLWVVIENLRIGQWTGLEQCPPA